MPLVTAYYMLQLLHIAVFLFCIFSFLFFLSFNRGIYPLSGELEKPILGNFFGLDCTGLKQNAFVNSPMLPWNGVSANH